MRNQRTSKLLTRLVGWLLVIAGVSVNKWTLEPLTDDGHIDTVIGVLFFFAFQWPTIFVGIALVMGRSIFKYRKTVNAFVAVTSLVIGVALVEGVIRYVRVFDPFLPRPRTYVGEFENRESRTFVSDIHTGWRMHSENEFTWSISGERDSYKSNEQGFRSGWNFEQPINRKIIALIGDSFAWGTGVGYEETFGELVATTLGDNFAVYNLAQPGFGLDQMWMSLRHQALRLEPALVIVAFIDNDLDRCFYAHRSAEGFNKPTFVVENGELRPQVGNDRPNGLLRFLETYSGIWTGLRRSAVREIGFSYPVGEWWSLNQAVFEAIVADARRAEIPLLFVRLPLREPKDFPSMHRLADNRNVALLDLGGNNTSRPQGIHFVDDSHINEAGHAYVAEQLSSWIRENRPVTE